MVPPPPSPLLPKYVIKRTLEIAYEEIRSKFRLQSALNDKEGVVNIEDFVGMVKEGLLMANEMAIGEMEEKQVEVAEEGREMVVEREMDTIVDREDIVEVSVGDGDKVDEKVTATPPELHAPSPTPSPNSSAVPPPPPPPSNGTKTLSVSVEAAIKMEEGMFRDYIQYTVVSEVVHDDPDDYDMVPRVRSWRVGRRYRDFDKVSRSEGWSEATAKAMHYICR